VRSDRSVIAFLAFLSVILAFGIDSSLPAFDELRAEFDLRDGSGEVSLIVTAYFLGMAAGQLAWGLSSDRTGRRTALLGGLVLYGIGAAGSAAADSMNTMLAARFVWGLGAAAPSVLRNSIARDLYSGDRLARITSLTMAIFLIGPAIAPSIGELILLTGNWRLVFAAAVPLALVGIGWTLRFGETMAPENARPLDFGTVRRGTIAFFRTRATIGYSMAITLGSGAFFIYLGSSQPIVDEIYGYGDWFALVFFVTAAGIGLTVWFSSRFISRFGADAVGATANAVMVASATVFVVACLVSDGRPHFAIWMMLATVFASATTVSTPAFVALAMTPMARIAGTASALNGVLTIGVASLLAVVFDRMIDDTVTPMAVGFLIYSTLALVAARWARGGSREIVEPEPG
jgi:DHA1 family bicyclomycin/chloramphenicol resistance-like MFS transporter